MMQLSGFRKHLEQNAKTQHKSTKKHLKKTIPPEEDDKYSQWNPPYQSTKGEN